MTDQLIDVQRKVGKVRDHARYPGIKTDIHVQGRCTEMVMDKNTGPKRYHARGHVVEIATDPSVDINDITILTRVTVPSLRLKGGEGRGEMRGGGRRGR